MSVVEVVARVQQIESRLDRMAAAPGEGAVPVEDAIGNEARFRHVLSTVLGEGWAVAPGTATGQDVAAAARRYEGVPYVFGGEDSTGMDCSGLVQRVLADLGIAAPRLVSGQADLGTEVPSLDQALPGDLIVTRGEGHIAIYLGDGKIIHAPKPGRNVEIVDAYMTDATIDTIRRVVPAAPHPAMQSVQAILATFANSGGPPLSFGGALAGMPALTASTASALHADAVALSAFSEAHATSDSLASGDKQGLAAATNPVQAAHAARAVAAQPPPVPLNAQVAQPIFSLATAKPGEHVLTINVAPENLGPVTVRAHVTSEHVRLELFAPSDAGREALRAILPDLRRDLAGGGMNAQLDVSSQNQPDDASGRRERAEGELADRGDGGGAGRLEPAASQPAIVAGRERQADAASTIDVLA